MARVASLTIFPLKSARGWPVAAAEVEARGLAGDRRWMVVDADGRFVTGRQCPRMVLLRARPGEHRGSLRLDFPGQPTLLVPAPARDAARRSVKIWKDSVDAAWPSPAADAWLSTALSRPVHLVAMDAAAERKVDPDYARPGDEVSFADGYPLLLLSTAAVAALDERLLVPVGAERFRANLLVEGTPAHAEDGWRRIRIGFVEFDVVKPCTRCVFTTVDPERGEIDASGEPLTTLKTYRRGPSGVTFGQNLVPRGAGRIAVGDRVEVLEHLL